MTIFEHLEFERLENLMEQMYIELSVICESKKRLKNCHENCLNCNISKIIKKYKELKHEKI